MLSLAFRDFAEIGDELCSNSSFGCMDSNLSRGDMYFVHGEFELKDGEKGDGRISVLLVFLILLGILFPVSLPVTVSFFDLLLRLGCSRTGCVAFLIVIVIR